jgi:hypothetical protein
MVTVSPEYHEVTRARGYDLLGMGKAQKRRTQRMEVGDRVLYYVAGLRVFSAMATVDSTYFEDHTRVWGPPDSNEDFPWRVQLRPSIVLNENEYIDARLIAPRMQYLRKWTPEDWPLAFQGPLHLVPKQDFMMLEDEMRKRSPTPKMDIKPDPSSRCALESLPLAQ